MPSYTLTYARTVILKTIVEADSKEEAWEKIHKMEYEDQTLGLASWKAKRGSWVDDVTDDENIWELEEDE